MTIIRPCTIQQAKDFVRTHHRHSDPPVLGRFAIALLLDDDVVGVAIVGRPVARGLDDGITAEITRLCVNERAPRNSCSRLARACWRAWSAMGGQRMITYTLVSEGGASLRGAGFRLVGVTKPQQWDTPSRRRVQKPLYQLRKHRWELTA